MKTTTKVLGGLAIVGTIATLAIINLSSETSNFGVPAFLK
jgi:hypothetical protein